MSSDAKNLIDSTPPRWGPLEAHDRRVLGVLVEKAKTTPDNYPLSLSALRAGCNQKSNRFPQMELEEYQIEEAIDRLRQRHAVSIIQGDGRVEKYRHLGYEWLGVDKVELAVMAELLLRGAQTIGELRGRAARMEPIKSMSELGPILQRLQEKALIVYLTPPGRGAVVTHQLYQPREMDKLRREHGATIPATGAIPVEPITATPFPASPPPADIAMEPPATEKLAAEGAIPPAAGDDHHDLLAEQIRELRQELTTLRSETESTLATLQEEVDDLKRQLGV